MTFKDKILLYLFNRSEAIEQEYKEHIQFVRFHNVDEVDLLETIIRKTRVELFNEVSKDIMSLLSTSDRGNLENFRNLIGKK